VAARLDALADGRQDRRADEFLELHQCLGADDHVRYREDLVVVRVGRADGDLFAVAALDHSDGINLSRKLLVDELTVHPGFVDGELDAHVRRLRLDNEDGVTVEEDDVVRDIALGQCGLVDERQHSQRLLGQDGLRRDFEEARVRQERHNELLLDVALRREVIFRDGQQAHGTRPRIGQTALIVPLPPGRSPTA
jgi:hypothetical protein